MSSGHETVVNATRCLAELIHYGLLDDEGDLEQAAELYQRVIDTNDLDAAPPAMFGKAQLLLADDPNAAAELYRRTIDTRHFGAAPRAIRALRALQKRRGEPVHPPLPPRLHPAAGGSGCHLVLDGDGAVEALWFEDEGVGSQHALDLSQIRDILVANKLGGLINSRYFGAHDGARGGYLIRFQRDD